MHDSGYANSQYLYKTSSYKLMLHTVDILP